MSRPSPTAIAARPSAGIAFIVLGVSAISVNGMLIKQLSDGYPLHQMVFARSLIGMVFSLMLVQIEGGSSSCASGSRIAGSSADSVSTAATDAGMNFVKPLAAV